MRNVRIRVAYDGSRFFGWQRQEGFESVQEAIEHALEDLTGEHLTVYGSGRTDTGVHALGQVANFHVDSHLSDNRMLYALNAHLPESVTVTDLETCSDAFHAQASAEGKRYLYLVHTSRFRDYSNLIGTALALAGWGDVGSYRGYRAEVEYPPYPCDLTMICEIGATPGA